ncbi:MAG: hypothetical protein U5N55_10750 [Cypionkella sp.]|nr:hypothetical protein [Cypionkella sp.]
MTINARQAREFRLLIGKLEPVLQRAFLAAMQEVRRGLDWKALIAALERRDVDAAVDALNIEPAAFDAYRQEAARAYAQGGATEAARIANDIAVRFDATNPRAEAWITTETGRRIQQISDETKAGARVVILSGYQQGQHPHTIARDLGGRVEGGRRTGGVIGLDAARADRWATVSEGMKTADGVRDLVEVRDGVPTVRYKVNKATAQKILSAYAKGEAVPASQRAVADNQYFNALLKARAETIAQTETAQAVMAARLEQWEQVLEKTGAPDDAVIKTWIHGGGPKEPRWWHVEANGMEVRGLNTPFVLANGGSLLCAHDPAAPGKETIRCTCDTQFRLDPLWRQRNAV